MTPTGAEAVPRTVRRSASATVAEDVAPDPRGAHDRSAVRARSWAARVVTWVLAASLLAVAGSAAARAQDVVHVSAEGPEGPVVAGTSFEVVVTATIDEPYHIYAHDSEGEFVTLTTLSGRTDDEHVSFAGADYPGGAKDLVVAELGETYQVIDGAPRFVARFDVDAAHPGGTSEVTVALLYKACDDTTCYPPEEPEFTVPVRIEAVESFAANSVPALAQATETFGESAFGGPAFGGGPAGLDKGFGGGAFGIGADDPVTVSVGEVEGDVLAGAVFEIPVRVTLDGGWHVYSHDSRGGEFVTQSRLWVETDADGVTFVESVYPEPHEYPVPELGETYDVFEGTTEWRARVHVAADRGPGPIELDVKLRYQACKDATCLLAQEPVYTRTVDVVGRADEPIALADVPRIGGEGGDTDRADVGGDSAVAPPSASVESRLRDELSSGSLAGFLWVSVLFGFISLLTPCVFPMVPVTVAFFSKRAERASGSPARYALAYGLGIVATYTGFGVGMALAFGAGSVQDFAVNPWVNLAIGALFVFFGLSLMGFYDLKPPAFLTKRAQAGATSGQGYAPVFVMGFVFTITAFTCTAPIVGSLLPLLSTSESTGLIVSGMLAYSTAFALPFVLLALFPSMLGKLPSAGGWMITLKATLGFAELIAALKFFSNADLVWNVQFLVRPAMIVATLTLTIGLALYLFGAFRLPHDVPSPRRWYGVRTLAALLVVGFSLYLSRGLLGRTLTGWVEAYLPPAHYGAPEGRSIHDEIDWFEDYDVALAEARRSDRNVFIDFTGITCINCRLVEASVFEDERFVDAIRDVVALRLYTDRRSPADVAARDKANKERMIEQFGSVTLPLYVLVDDEGNELGRLEYSEDVGKFLALLATPVPES